MEGLRLVVTLVCPDCFIILDTDLMCLTQQKLWNGSQDFILEYEKKKRKMSLARP